MRTISTELLRVAVLEGINVNLAIPHVPATHHSKPTREHTPSGPDIIRHILRLIVHLSETKPRGIGYIWSSSELHPPSANTLSLLGQGTLLDASKCGSGAYRNTRIWQNLLPHDTLTAEHASLQPPARPVDAALETAGPSTWSSHPPPKPGDPH